MIDYGAMDMIYLLGQIRSDEVMSSDELLSILARKVDQQKRDHIESSHSIESESGIAGQTVTVKEATNSLQTQTAQTVPEGFRTEETWLDRDTLMGLTVGDRIDVRDKYGKYIGAEIVEKSRNKWKIHFISWSTAWDQWITTSDRKRIAAMGQISARKVHKTQLCDLDVDDHIMVKLPSFHEHAEYGWILGTVIERDGGQLNVQYRVHEAGGGRGTDSEENLHEYWVHADNLDECR